MVAFQLIEQTHVTKAAVFIDTVQKRVTRKPEEKIERKTTYKHILSSVRDLILIYIDGEFHKMS